MDFSDAARKWDDRYRRANGLLFGAQPNEWLVANADALKPGSEILCVADGEGRNSTWLAGLGHQVQAFDISPVAVARLRELAGQRQVSVDARVASLQDWTWSTESLDAVVAVFIQFAGPQTRSTMFSNIADALRPAGLFIIEGYGLSQLRYRTGGPGVAENLYTMALFTQAFPGWQVLASREVHRHLAEGSGHVGRSHLISLMLRKPAPTAD